MRSRRTAKRRGNVSYPLDEHPSGVPASVEAVLTETVETTADAENQSVECQRNGCNRVADVVWTSSNGVVRAFCAEDDVEINIRALRYLDDDNAAAEIESYRYQVESQLTRGLYGMKPGRLYRNIPGDS